MKWSQAFVGSVLALSAQAGNATSLPPCPSTSHLVDTISAVGGKTKKIMTDRLAVLDRETTDQIVALTIDDKGTYGYASMRDLGIAYAEACKIGSSTTDRGVLISYERATHNYAIEISRGLEGEIPDLAARRKILDVAAAQCEKKSPGCILDKSTIQIERILRSKTVPQAPRETLPIRVHNNPPVAKVRLNQDTEENTIDAEGGMVIGGIMLTSLLAGLGWMGYSNRRSRSSFGRGIGGNFQQRNKVDTERLNKGLKDEIERIKLELTSEGFLLGDIPGQIVWSQYDARSVAIGVLENLRRVRSHYQGLSTFAQDVRTEFETGIGEYETEKSAHDTIYGNSSGLIDTVGLRDSFESAIEAFSAGYPKKDIPQILLLEKQARAVLGQVKRAKDEYSQANQTYNQIPLQVSQRRSTLSKIRHKDEYRQNEMLYRRKTGDGRFQSYNLTGTITTLSGILDSIEEMHRTKLRLPEVPRLILRFDESFELMNEYIDLGPKLRRIKEDERQERLRADRALDEEQDLLRRRRGAAIVYTNTSGGGDSGEVTRVPERGGAGYAGGGTEITIEPERNDNGGDAGVGNDDKEDS